MSFPETDSRVQFADFDRLVARIVHSVRSNDKLTFLLGSAINTPLHSAESPEPGVPGAAEIVQSVLAEFIDPDEKDTLASLLRNCPVAAHYQEAMQFVIDCRGQDTLNRLIQDAVLRARKPNAVRDRETSVVEADTEGWHLRPATNGIGKLIAEYPAVFSAPILTSNFDPLIEVLPASLQIPIFTLAMGAELRGAGQVTA